MRPVVSDSPMILDCPLCGTAAKKFTTNGDWSRYECPNHETFDIVDSEEAETRASASKRQAHSDRIARERRRGIEIPRIGIFPEKERRRPG
jgi:uncharacterized Zn finger protein (UPF0148 family)